MSGEYPPLAGLPVGRIDVGGRDAAGADRTRADVSRPGTGVPRDVRRRHHNGVRGIAGAGRSDYFLGRFGRRYNSTMYSWSCPPSRFMQGDPFQRSVETSFSISARVRVCL